MSKYTATLSEFFMMNQDGTLSNRDLIEKGRTQLFDFDYPIYDETYRAVFETHFIRKFYLREIGSETFGYFKFQLETWLLINMPYWNKMFESESLQYDPLTNVKLDLSHNKRNDRAQNDQSTGTSDRSTNGTTSGTSTENADETRTGSSKNTKAEDTNENETDFERNVRSDTPDGRLQLTLNDGQGALDYASEISEDRKNNERSQSSNGTSETDSSESNSSNTSQSTNATSNQTDNLSSNNSLTSSINDVEDYIEHKFGKDGVQTFASMVKEYRETLLRIEAMIFEEMNELFMLVY